MKTNLLLILVVLLAGCSLLVLAQAEETDASKIPLPPRPWPARTPDRASWTVVLDLRGTFDGSGEQSSGQNDRGGASSGGGSSPNAPSPTLQMTFTVVKTWPVVHEVAVNGEGQKWDKWFKDGTMITLTPTSPDLIISRGGQDAFYFKDYTKTDFDGFDWLSEKNFRGITDYQGHRCYYFRNPMRANAAGPPTLLAPDAPVPPTTTEGAGSSGQLALRTFYAKAYLDVKTLLPVMVQKGPEIRTYQFNSPPQTDLDLPPDFLKKIAERVALQKRITTPPSRPF